MQDAFADLIFVGTVRHFYSEEKAQEFAALVAERGYKAEVVHLPGEDLAWRVQVLNDLNKLDPKSQS